MPASGTPTRWSDSAVEQRIRTTQDLLARRDHRHGRYTCPLLHNSMTSARARRDHRISHDHLPIRLACYRATHTRDAAPSSQDRSAINPRACPMINHPRDACLRRLPASAVQGDPAVRKRICKPDAAEQHETGEPKPEERDGICPVRRGHHTRERRSETPKTHVVWLITQRSRVQIPPPLLVSAGQGPFPTGKRASGVFGV